MTEKQAIYYALSTYKNCGLSEAQAKLIVDKHFDNLVKTTGSHKAATNAIWDEFGSGSLSEALKPCYEASASFEAQATAGTLNYLPSNPTSRKILAELETIRERKLDVLPPRERIKIYAKKYNSLIAGLQATLTDARHSNIPIVSDTDKERLFLHFGETKATHDQEYQSWASFKEGRAILE